MLVELALKHHGVKGMKWGVRKAPSSSAPHVSPDHVIAEGHKSVIKEHGVKALSNADLEALNKRMQLEQTHRDLKGKAPGKLNGGEHVNKLLKTGKKLNDIYNTVNGPIGKAAIKVAKAKVS